MTLAKKLGIKKRRSKKRRSKDDELFIEEEKEEGKIYDPVQLATKFSKLPFNIKAIYDNKFKAHQRYLVRMLLRNGDRKDVIIFSTDGSFRCLGGMYVIDESLAHFNMSARLWELEYHQDYTLPIDRSINMQEVRKMSSDPQVSDLDVAFNPYQLEKFSESKVTEGMMKGAGLADWLKQMKLILIVLVVIGAAHLLLFVIKTGMLQSVAGVVPGF